MTKHNIKSLVTSLLLLMAFTISINAQSIEENEIYQFIEQKNFFKAKEIYFQNKEHISVDKQHFIEASLYNAFNQLEESNKKIETLLKAYGSTLADSLVMQIYTLKNDNDLKLNNYGEAKKSLEFILRNHSTILDNETTEDYNNSLKICSAIQDKPKQKVVINSNNKIKLIKDKAGLDNLKVAKELDTLNFIFDTGANISTTSRSVAELMKMEIIPVDIEVGTITGIKIPAQLAICDKMSIGSIDIYNAIFLVLEDEGLYFPQIDYKIYGIIGYPIIEALKEIQITQDGYFMVPKNETVFSGEQNLAMDGLVPLVYFNNKHFFLDTGADSTILFHKYYQENKDEIDSNYEQTQISFGGAGGTKEFKGFIINQVFEVSDKLIALENIQLLTEKVKPKETVYGNIGQDVIKKFYKMTLNFNQMHIKFD